MVEVKLSPKQQEIVDIDNGAILVKASAGSGKTRVLTERIKRLINKTRRKILAITFTNKAGEEMKERLGTIPDIENRLFVGTFHGFCEQVLTNHGNLIGYNEIPHIFEDETDRLQLVEKAIQSTPTYYEDYCTFDKKKQNEFRYNALGFISETKRDLKTADDLLNNGYDESMVLLYSSYQDILNAQNAIDYDDLIALTYNLFIENPKIAALYRRTYEYICIDEAQDLNYAQYQLIRALTGTEHKNVMMVGDPNQSIFAFAGSSSDYMNKMFVSDYKPVEIDLKENYRSSIKVIEAAERIIPDTCETKNLVIKGVFEIYGAENEMDEANWICNKISYLIKQHEHPDIEGIINYEKFAVIARNKYLFKELDAKFSSLGIPYYYKITPGPIKFESHLMKIFDLAFRVKINPKDTLHWYKLLPLLKNKDAKDLQELSLKVNDTTKLILQTVLNLKDDGSNFKYSIEQISERLKNDRQLVNDDREIAMVLNDSEELL